MSWTISILTRKGNRMMSQRKKVDNAQRQKRNLMLQNGLIVLAVVAVFGFFVYTSVIGLLDTKTETHYVHTQVLSDYMQNLDAEGVQ